ncbi:hypothetical protein BAE44_0005641 [Dichanthelium oligosanthes]|uniref:UBA domain-containing protein n=1 Tax=Dichanthelium oligosanthes TaxID=888268 RepID=A0A1E5W7G5_9POAL|nr:hypothetical protein BAE44_0005641 [Dichanthelium oligosanthes]
MEYDFRGRSGSGSYGGAAPGGGGGSSLYPRVGQPSHAGGGSSTASPRAAPYHHGSGAGSGSSAPIVTPLAPTSSSSKVGIQVAIKPEFRITPPPRLPPQMVEIPRSTFNFDFEYERRILAEAEKENPNWSKFVVKEFVKSYNILHEMGFTTSNVPELLAIHDNDPDKVIQRLLSSPS